MGFFGSAMLHAEIVSAKSTIGNISFWERKSSSKILKPASFHCIKPQIYNPAARFITTIISPIVKNFPCFKNL